MAILPVATVVGAPSGVCVVASLGVDAAGGVLEVLFVNMPVSSLFVTKVCGVFLFFVP